MQSQKYNSLLKLVANDGGHIKINRKLVAKYGIEVACVYSELLNMQINSKKNRENFLFLDSDCFSLNTEKLSDELGISPHKQRVILQTLQEEGLIQVYYGSGKNRLIKVNDDIDVLYEVLNPSEDIDELYFENLFYDINVLKNAILKSLKQLYRKEEKRIFEDKFFNYIKKYNKKEDDEKLQIKLFECLLEDNSVQKEIAKGKIAT